MKRNDWTPDLQTSTEPVIRKLVIPVRRDVSLLNHGVENPADVIHGDEEYHYVVELPSENPFDEPTEWTVEVGGHSAFPRWEGPTNEAFERASWQFHGSLKSPLEDLLPEPA